jgi:hypothetical protein
MGASKAVIPVLVTMMLVTGVCNTLLTKYQVLPPLFRPSSAHSYLANKDRTCNAYGIATLPILKIVMRSNNPLSRRMSNNPLLDTLIANIL